MGGGGGKNSNPVKTVAKTVAAAAISPIAGTAMLANAAKKVASNSGGVVGDAYSTASSELNAAGKTIGENIPLYSSYYKGQKNMAKVAQEGANAQKDMVDAQVKEFDIARKEKANELKTAQDQKAQEAINAEATQGRDSARTRQRKLALGARGRQSTILTESSPAADTSKKTLLGQ